MTLEFLYNLAQNSTKDQSNFEYRQKKHYSNQKTCRFFFQSMDNIINKTLSKMTSELVSFWEHVYGFTIQSLLVKFLHDPINQDCQFLGGKRLIIMRKQTFEHIIDNNVLFVKSEDIQDLQISREILIKCLENSTKSLEKIRPKGTIQVLSRKLLSKMALEECHGDFCKYEFLVPEKDILKPHRPEYQGQNTMNHNQRVLGSEFGVLSISFLYKL